MTYGHLRADCLYTGISSGPNARYRVWESLYLYLYTIINFRLNSVMEVGALSAADWAWFAHGLFIVCLRTEKKSIFVFYNSKPFMFEHL